MDNTLCVLCACVCFVSGTGCMFYPPTPSIGSNVTFSLNEWMVQLSIMCSSRIIDFANYSDTCTCSMILVKLHLLCYAFVITVVQCVVLVLFE